MITSEKAKELLQKYNEGNITDQEKALLESWYLQHNRSAEPPTAEKIASAKERVWKTIEPVKNIDYKPKSSFSVLIGYAAVFLIALTIGGYFVLNTNQSSTVKTVNVNNPVLPGENKAILTLADGTQIDLDEKAIGEIGMQEGIRIAKTPDNQLVYITEPGEFDRPYKEVYNMVSTPTGGQFQVVLPDGTKVWLNASSSLHYPTKFNAIERKVELKGEAYFEVSKGKIPFKVVSEGQEIEVLGTHFNVNAYTEEPFVATTLIEGSVKVRSTQNDSQGKSVILKPNQQVLLNQGNMELKEVDVDNFVGWKNNLIVFESQNLDNIMRQIARWYDVEIDFKDESLKNKKFSGKISKYKEVSEVLKMLELTDLVHFDLKERRILVMK